MQEITQETQVKETTTVETNGVVEKQVEKEPYITTLENWAIINQAFSNPFVNIPINNVMSNIHIFDEVSKAQISVFIKNEVPEKLSLEARKLIRDIVSGSIDGITKIKGLIDKQIEVEQQALLEAQSKEIEIEVEKSYE